MSAGWDGELLLEPITAEQPCGENLEDTQLLASFDGFRVFGQATMPETEPAWNDIRTEALAALARSKDLRLLAHLGAAVLRTDGVPAFSSTLRVASHWLSTYWGGTYPLLDEDAVVRRNALNCFADPVAVVEGLRRAPLVSDRQLGKLTLRDIEIAAGQVPPKETDTRVDEGQIGAAFAAMPIEDLRALRESVSTALASLKTIDAQMRGEGGPEAAPSFEPLSAQLTRMDRVLRAQLASHPDGTSEDAGADSADGEPGARGGGGVIRSRQDATRALDAVADFFRQTEPSSPVPMLLDRAKRLVSKNFLEVIADLAPEAVGQVRAAGGLRDGE